jgi:hypothetical protein
MSQEHSIISDDITPKLYQTIIAFKKIGQLPIHYTELQRKRFIERFGRVQVHPKTHLLMLNGKTILDYKMADVAIVKAWQEPRVGYQSAQKLYKRFQQNFIGVSRSHVQEVLSRFEANQIIGPKFSQITVKPLKIIQPMTYFQADLIDKQSLAGSNNKKAYLLCIIDVFSKYAYVEPLSNKESASLIAALTKVFDEVVAKGGKPKVLHTDNGSEFKNAAIQVFLTDRGMRPVYGQAYKYQSQGAVERFNSTIQMIIHRYLLQNQTNRYIDVLPKLVQNYNEAYHNTTKDEPVDLYKPKDQIDRKKLKAARHSIREQADRIAEKDHRIFPEVKKGDYVRVMQLKFMKEAVKQHAVKYRPDLYVVYRRVARGTDYDYIVSSNLKNPEEGPHERVYRYQIKLVPAPERLIPMKKLIKPTAQPKEPVIAMQAKPRRLDVDTSTPVLKRSERVPKAPQRVRVAGENVEVMSYKQPTKPK